MSNLILMTCKAPCPCKGCERRHKGCHNRCPNYKAWRTACDDETEFIRKSKNKERIVNDYVAEHIDKARKNKG